MDEYFDNLCLKYKINIDRSDLMLYKNLFSCIELVEGSETYNYIKDGLEDVLSSVTVKYGDNNDKQLDVKFYLRKNIFDNEYRIGDFTGDLFFWYNNEYYVIHGLDVDELDEESMEFKVSVFGDEKIRKIHDIQARQYSRIPVLPVNLFKYDIEPDCTALYTRFAPGCQEDFITLSIKLIEREKEYAQSIVRSKGSKQ